ncbi:MAG TPA: ankyrin repeat domain-containing protein [Patescibacteria group bacterium]|nr:ankyrin repeat domain-containing protein [Patescibacteria group bacterium]
MNLSPQAAATLMANAIRSDNPDALHRLLFEDTANPDALHQGSTMLHHAARAENDRAITMLLQAGADIHLTDAQGGSVLRAAIKSGNAVSVRKLLAAGADPTAISPEDDGSNPSDDVLATRYGGEVSHAVNMAVDPFRVNQYARLQKAEWMEGYLLRGVPADTIDRFGKTALIEAVELGYKDGVEVLLRHRADPNRVMRDGRTAMHYAAEKGYVDLIENLAAAGAKLNTALPDGRTPLQLAEAAGNKSAAAVILKLQRQQDAILADSATRLSQSLPAPKTARFTRRSPAP